MHSVFANILLLLASAPALTPAESITIGGKDCQMLECPSGWSSSSCNNNAPDFCCPGGVQIHNDDASCCIGGDPFSHTCAGGTLIPVGPDMDAYSSSVYAAMSSTSAGTGGGGASKTTAPPKPVTTTDDSGNTVTSTPTQADATSKTEDAAAAGITGMSGAAMGMALGVVMIARNI